MTVPDKENKVVKSERKRKFNSMLKKLGFPKGFPKTAPPSKSTLSSDYVTQKSEHKIKTLRELAAEQKTVKPITEIKVPERSGPFSVEARGGSSLPPVIEPPTPRKVRNIKKSKGTQTPTTPPGFEGYIGYGRTTKCSVTEKNQFTTVTKREITETKYFFSPVGELMSVSSTELVHYEESEAYHNPFLNKTRMTDYPSIHKV